MPLKKLNPGKSYNRMDFNSFIKISVCHELRKKKEKQPVSG